MGAFPCPIPKEENLKSHDDSPSGGAACLVPIPHLLKHSLHDAYHSPRNVYKLIPLPVFFLYFFVIFTGIRCGTDFFL